MIKRITTLVFVLLTIVGNAVWGQETSWTGSGTETDPYKICSKTDLESLATSVNNGESYEGKYFELTQSIDLEGDESNQWTPIGDYYSVMGSSQGTSFKGIFDGKGNTVSGLYMKTSNFFKGDGLFGWIGNTDSFSETAGIVKNLTVEGTVEMSIIGPSMTGGICGYNYGTIQNCTSNISFEMTGNGLATVGGICGTNGGLIQGCTNKGDISISESNSNGGGICGVNVGKIEKCSNEGAVSGGNTTNIGGISGLMQDNLNENPIINNCFNSGTLTLNSEHGNIAGICVIQGVTSQPTREYSVTNCHNYGSINSSASHIGGIVCQSDEITHAEISVENCYYINTITPSGAGEDIEGVEPKSADAFANGEVLYLLQQDNPGVWKQGEKGYPVFIGDEEEETILYKVTFDYNYEGSPEAIVNYLEAGETVTFPTMEREGYTFTNWSTDATGETPVEDITSITLTSDMTYYAQWQSSETEEPGDDDEDQGDTGIHKPQRPIKYYNIYVDTICPGLNVEVSKDVVQEGHQVSAYLTIQAECDTTGMRFEYKRGLFGYWKDLKELEGVQPGEYIIKNIYTDIYIRALDATLPEEEPTGIEDLEGVKAYAKDGSIYVYTPNREEVTIIGMSGAIIKHAEQVGLQSYSVSRGIYIVRIGEKVFKLKN